MRRIFVLGVMVLLLIGSGILTVQWGNDSATIKFNKEKAKERTEQLLDKARQLETNVRENAEQNDGRRD